MKFRRPVVQQAWEGIMFWVVIGLLAFLFVVVTRKEFKFLAPIHGFLGEWLVLVDFLGWIGLLVYFGRLVYVTFLVK